MSDLHGRSCIALVVDHEFSKRSGELDEKHVSWRGSEESAKKTLEKHALFIEETRQHESGVVEHELYVDTLRRFVDLVQIARCTEVHTNLNKLASLKLRL